MSKIVNSLVTAVFVGQHGSLGYQKDGTYHLKMEEHPGSSAIFISRMDGSGQNKYSNISALLNNWSFITKGIHDAGN